MEKSVGLSFAVQCGRGYVDTNLQDCGRMTSDTKFYPSSVNKHMYIISKYPWQSALISTFLCSFIYTFNRLLPSAYSMPNHHGRYGRPVSTCVNTAPVATKQPISPWGQKDEANAWAGKVWEISDLLVDCVSFVLPTSGRDSEPWLYCKENNRAHVRMRPPGESEQTTGRGGDRRRSGRPHSGKAAWTQHYFHVGKPAQGCPTFLFPREAGTLDFLWILLILNIHSKFF